jgi:hypothetical protein
MLFNTSDFVFIFVWLAVTLHLLRRRPQKGSLRDRYR